MKIPLSILLFLLIFSCVSFSQEIEIPLGYSPIKAQRYAEEKRAAPKEARGGSSSLSLPFFDDFSRYSLPTNLPSVPAEYQMWSDTSVYINCTFPIAPLTIGVATFDGFMTNGHPYQYATNDNFPKGFRDSLTSLPIDLSSYLPEDTLQLVFYHEEGGNGNEAEEFDTLYLDFFKPQGTAGDWVNVWTKTGSNSTTSFEQVFVELLDADYLQDGFKFRFRNWGRLGGSVDHWHLDYVLLADGIDPANFQLDEVAFQYCNNTLLNFGYTAMPWTHYLEAPDYFMADNIVVHQNNLGEIENVTTHIEIENNSNGSNVFTSDSDLNPAAPVGEIARTIPLEGYAYSPLGSETEASFTICATFNQTDAHLQNDTMCFEQNFSNYYAYDDCSAESGWGINQEGARTAVRFDCVIPDTLIGVLIHWLPFLVDWSDKSFLLRVYDVNGNIPGSELNADDFNFYNYNYNYDGLNQYYYYPLNTPLAMDGPFFFGWIQQALGSQFEDLHEVYIGNDRNTNMNTTQLYYKFNAFSDWTNSITNGSIMFRPVFQSSMPEWVGVAENTEAAFHIFPNPAQDKLNIEMPIDHEKYWVYVIDISGRVVRKEQFINNGLHILELNQITQGAYILQLVAPDGNTTKRHFIITK